MHAARNALILWNVAWALTLSSIQPYAQVAPGPAASPRDYYRAGIAAAARGNFTEAAELLKQLKPEHPQYAKAMALLADQIYCGALHRPQEGVAFAQKAYAAAPTDNDVVRAYIRTHVLAGVWFDDKDIARERPKTVSKQYAFLVSKPRFDDASRKFPRAKLEADLAFVEHVLAGCFAYLEVKPVDYRTALDTIRVGLEDETSVNAFEICLTKLLSLFCDGHARLAPGRPRFLPKGYAPFVAGSRDRRVFLANPTGKGFLDQKHPYVTAIDGKPIEEWMEAAGYLVAKESPQWHLRGALEMFGFVTYLRGELGLPHTNTITLKLESEDRTDSAERQLPIQQKFPQPLEFPHGDTRRIGDFGYLRLSQMTSSERVLSDLDDWMAKFRDTQGLILDVRGNLGGTKDILHTIFPYFMKPGAPMRIVEMTTYRLPRPLPKPNPSGFARSTMSGQTVGSSHWKTQGQRQQVAEFIKNFRPEWNPPSGKFSEWHALGLDAKVNPRAYYYDKPLIVLQDSSTFSAGDIFVGAFEDHPNTTQMGTPTGGGNSLMERYRLPNTGLLLIVGWSAKFRPNGKLYDGTGIPPDIFMAGTPQDLVGETDSVLDAAVRRLKEHGGSKPKAPR